MCGIVGIVSSDDANETLERPLASMLRAQAHRGPDGSGQVEHVFPDARVALGHGRLAILDLSDAAAQPMVSADGNDVLIFNGEIFNYLELRAELESQGARFHGSSDTEVLLEALRRWGPSCLRRFDGMWAFAWLDRRARRLVLSRDRFGIKPLYFWRDGRRLVFASEIKGVLAGVEQRVPVNVEVVSRYLTQGLLDAQEATFFEGIESLPAGSVAEIHLSSGLTPHVRSFWSIDDEAPLELGVEDAIAAVRKLLRVSVERRLRSDVPVGVLLSGGVDSSAIAAMVAHVAPDADVRLLSATSEDPRYDESRFVRQVASHLRRDVGWVRLDFDADEAFRLLDDVTFANDEPVGTFSWVAHYLLMRQAHAVGVTVLLSGQGADEILCGYRKYLGFHLQDLARRGHPFRAARTLSEFIRNRTVVTQFQFDEAKRYLPHVLRGLEHDTRGPRLRSVDGTAPLGLGSGGLEARQREDIYRYSVPSLVHYEDRMSMAFGREIRLPFLEHELVSKVLRLPAETKLRDGWTKWILRKAVEDLLPPEITWRKDKQGFLNPQALWLKRELRSRIDAILCGPMLVARLGLVDQVALIKRYRDYCAQPVAGGRVGFRDVFHPIALEIWAQRFRQYLSDG